MLYSHHHNQFRTIPHTKEKPVPISNNSSFPSKLCPPSSITYLKQPIVYFFTSKDFPILNIYYIMVFLQYMVFCDQFLLFNPVFLMCIHFVSFVSISFPLLMNKFHLQIHQFLFIYSSVDDHLNYFYFSLL